VARSLGPLQTNRDLPVGERDPNSAIVRQNAGFAVERFAARKIKKIQTDQCGPDLMSKSALVVENLSKKYLVGHKRGHPKQRDTTLREVIAREARSFARNASDVLRGRPRIKSDRFEEFWALKNINFEIRQGEVVGIIGRNGAGKSTLLKILSRITESTEGRVKLRGRVASLLEVGTGFHQELTGRENIFLNGAILGMTQREIKRKFDEIVAFAEVERFLDTPVKRYSSGMYVRLAFAVAAHLEPEILIVDEVLAVGDAAFQKKCLGKMEGVATEGRTVLFVSHNMAALQNLCPRAIVLDQGCIVQDGTATDGVTFYLQQLHDTVQDKTLAERKDRKGNGAIRLTSFHIEDHLKNIISATQSGADVVFVLGYCGAQKHKLNKVDVGISLHTEIGQTLSVMYSSYVNQIFDAVPSSGTFRLLIKKLPLAAGRYRVGARVLVGGDEADWPQDGVAFIEVGTGDYYGTGNTSFGFAAPMLTSGDWSLERAVGAELDEHAV
jgi:lipopolysaccharide transport system ATP-binding protein